MRVARPHFTQRGLRDKYGARVAQFRSDEAIPFRHVAFEQDGSHCGRHFLYIALILERQRNAVQRPDWPALYPGRVQRIRLL